MYSRRTVPTALAATIIATVVIATVALGAPRAEAKNLDSGKTKAAAVIVAKKDYPEVKVTDPICPSKVKQQTGLDFACTVKLNGLTLTYLVHQKNDTGNVRFDPVEAVIDTKKASDAIVANLKTKNAGKVISVDCGTAKIKVIAPAKTFDCTAKVGTTTGVVRVTVKDNTGNVDFKSV